MLAIADVDVEFESTCNDYLPATGGNDDDVENTRIEQSVSHPLRLAARMHRGTLGCPVLILVNVDGPEG